jgi:predicted amino acid-binding ACT domain protein
MWTSVFHLEAKLDSHVGALSVFTDLLARHGVNILHVTSPLSGYRQVTFAALCNLPALRDKLTGILTPPTSLADTPAQRFRRIGWETLSALTKVYAAIRREEHELWVRTHHQRRTPLRDGFFLHPRNVEIGPQPWYLKWSNVQQHVAADLDAEARSDLRAWASAAERLTHSDTFVEHADKATEEAEWFQRLPFTPEEKLFYMLWREHWMSPLTVRALLTLTYSRVWSHTSSPMHFTYDAQRTMLVAERKDYFSHAYTGMTVAVPSVAVASVHTVDRFARIRFFDATEQPFRVTIDYKLERTAVPGPSQAPPSTRGFLAAVSGAMAEKDVDILDIANTVRSSTPTGEEGDLVAMGVWTEAQADAAAAAHALKESIETQVKSRLRSQPGWTVDDYLTLGTDVRPYGAKALFLSVPFDALKDYQDAVQQVAQAFGFVVLIAKRLSSDEDGVTTGVLRDIKSCSAMVQIATGPRRNQETPQATSQPWLAFEYGAARMLNVSVLRFRERSCQDADPLDREYAIQECDPGDMTHFKEDLLEGLLRVKNAR